MKMRDQRKWKKDGKGCHLSDAGRIEWVRVHPGKAAGHYKFVEAVTGAVHEPFKTWGDVTDYVDVIMPYDTVSLNFEEEKLRRQFGG